MLNGIGEIEVFYEDILHYTVGPSEQGVVGTSFTNQWNYQ